MSSTAPHPPRRVLVVGATGFIGAHLARRLAAGHRVTAMARSRRRLAALAPQCQPLALDPGRLDSAEAWAPHVAGMDAVVNALGVIAGDFERLHTRVPMALFDACRAAGVRRVVQISALGAAADAPTAFLRSKAAADAYLLAQSDLDGVVVRPSVVLGAGGGSSRLFAALAALPLLPRLGEGGGLLQPIHRDDLTAGLAALVENDARGVLAACGPEPVHLDDLLAWFRRWLELPPAPALRVPPRLVAATAPLGGALGLGPLGPDTLAMLRAGSTAPPEPFAAASGVTPAGLDEIRRRHPAAPAERLAARLFFLAPLLRLSLAFLWLATAAMSLGLYPVSESYALLAAVGAAGIWQPLLLYSAALWDGLLGLMLLLRRHVRLVGWLQIATIATFTAIISVWLPEFWLHPFGPVTKNLPIVAATLVMIVLEDEA